MSDMIRKARATDVTAGAGREVVARISTTAVDRDGDVILPSGLNATNYKRNPVVLWGHDASAFPIGKVVRLQKRSDEIEAVVQFAERPAEHPREAEWAPDTVLSLFKQGVLRAFSVGFSVPDGGYRDATDKDRRKFGDSVRQVVTDWELLELSVVPIPANQDALAMAVAKGLRIGPVVAKAMGVDVSLTTAEVPAQPRIPRTLDIPAA